jgi:hypothetical protein
MYNYFIHNPKCHLEVIKLAKLLDCKSNKLLKNIKTWWILMLSPSKRVLNEYKIVKMVQDFQPSTLQKWTMNCYTWCGNFVKSHMHSSLARNSARCFKVYIKVCNFHMWLFLLLNWSKQICKPCTMILIKGSHHLTYLSLMILLNMPMKLCVWPNGNKLKP